MDAVIKIKNIDPEFWLKFTSGLRDYEKHEQGGVHKQIPHDIEVEFEDMAKYDHEGLVDMMASAWAVWRTGV